METYAAVRSGADAANCRLFDAARFADYCQCPAAADSLSGHLAAGCVVQTGIKSIEIIQHEPGKHSEYQYGGDPSKDVRTPLPQVIDQSPIHVSPHAA